MPKQDDLKKTVEIEKNILLGYYQKNEYGILSSMESDELQNREVKKKKLENELKVAESNSLRQNKFRGDRKQKIFSGQK